MVLDLSFNVYIRYKRKRIESNIGIILTTLLFNG